MWIIKMMKIHLKGSIKNCLRTIGCARSVAYRSLPGNRHQHNIGLLTGKRQSKNSGIGTSRIVGIKITDQLFFGHRNKNYCTKIMQPDLMTGAGVEISG